MLLICMAAAGAMLVVIWLTVAYYWTVERGYVATAKAEGADLDHALLRNWALARIVAVGLTVIAIALLVTVYLGVVR